MPRPAIGANRNETGADLISIERSRSDIPADAPKKSSGLLKVPRVAATIPKPNGILILKKGVCP